MVVRSAWLWLIPFHHTTFRLCSVVGNPRNDWGYNWTVSDGVGMGLRIIIDARGLTLYKPLTSVFHGATEMLLQRLARHLARRHDVHVLSIEEEQVVDGVTWWPGERGPRKADVFIQFANNAGTLGEFTCERAYVFQTSPHVVMGKPQDKNWERVNAFVALSETQSRLTKELRPLLKEERLLVIKPGVDVPKRQEAQIPNRLIYCSSADRGLIHLCHIWPLLKREVPNISLRVTYLPQGWIEDNRWRHDLWGEYALELERWFQTDSSVIAGRAKRELGESPILEMQKAVLHAMPMDPLNIGDGAHMLAGMECAASGCALLYSTCEGLPEIFGKAADFLALPINDHDWAAQIVDILGDKERLCQMQERAQVWAKTQPWSHWEYLWRHLVEDGRLPSRPSRPAESVAVR